MLIFSEIWTTYSILLLKDSLRPQVAPPSC